MYAGTGISTDSARKKKSKRWARWTAKRCLNLFHATPMPDLKLPERDSELQPGTGQAARIGVAGMGAPEPCAVATKN
jgi:hypothetical protein